MRYMEVKMQHYFGVLQEAQSKRIIFLSTNWKWLKGEVIWLIKATSVSQN